MYRLVHAWLHRPWLQETKWKRSSWFHFLEEHLCRLATGRVGH
jgi:hypothetical protein